MVFFELCCENLNEKSKMFIIGIFQETVFANHYWLDWVHFLLI